MPAQSDAGSSSLTPDISPSGSGRSIGFAAAGESLGDGNVVCRHIRNKYTHAFWINKTAAGGVIYQMSDSVGGAVALQVTMTLATNIAVIMRNVGSGAVAKNYRTTITSGAWTHFAFVVDVNANNPTSEQLITYVNGVKASPTKTTDLTLNDGSARVVDSFSVIGSNISGNFHSIAMWDTVLSAQEIAAIYNNGVGNVNLAKRKGKYKSQKRLQHWWFWDTTTTLGINTDYGKSRNTEPMDLFANSANIDATDLEVNAPGY